MVWRFGDFVASEARRDAIHNERDEMREILGRLRERGTLVDRFNSLFDRLSTLPWTAAGFDRKAAELERQHPGLVDIYVFDAQGKRVLRSGSANALVFASQQFLKALRAPDNTGLAKLSGGFAGNTDAPRLMGQAPGSLVDLVNGDKRTWGGWWRLTDAKGNATGDVVVFVHRGGIAADTLCDQAVAETNHLVETTYLCGWLDPLQPTQLRPASVSYDPGLASFLDRLSFDQAAVEWQGRSLVTQQGPDGETLFCVARQPHAPVIDVNQIRFGATIFVVIAFVFLRGIRAIDRRLVRKLVFLFVIGGGVPLLVLLVTVVIDRSDREQLLIKQTCEAQIEHLSRLDSEMSAMYRPIIRRYRQISARIDSRPLVESVAMRRELESLVLSYRGIITCVAIVSRRGRVFANIRTQGSGATQAMREAWEALPQICRGILQTVNYDPHTGSTGAETNPLTGVLVSSKYPSIWIDEEDRVLENRLGNEDALSYFRFFTARNRAFRGILMSFFDSFVVQTRYLQRLHRYWPTGRPGAARLWAMPVSGEKRWPVFLPAGLIKSHELRKLRDQVLNTGLPQNRLLWAGGKRFLVSAVKGQFLKGYVVMLARPYSVIDAESRRLSDRAGRFVLFMLLLAGAVAILSARLLLAPLQELGRGLVALSGRDFGQRIRPGWLVELAIVGEHFNTTMARFEEMKVARSVQEMLWPAKGLTGQGWSVAGRCRTATNLGGDHHEWLTLPDGRLVIATGDVAGHGIPAGLVVASVKMALALSVQTETDPAHILASVDQCLREQGGRFKPMTFWLGIFDPPTCRLSYASAGSCYPMLVVRGEAPRMLEMAGYPLGSRKKPVFQSDVVDLSAGGRLVLYTDGFPEAPRLGEGTPFDYTNLLRVAQETRNATLDTSIDRFFAEVTFWAGAEVPVDDQTLVILDVEARP